MQENKLGTIKPKHFRCTPPSLLQGAGGDTVVEHEAAEVFQVHKQSQPVSCMRVVSDIKLKLKRIESSPNQA